MRSHRNLVTIAVFWSGRKGVAQRLALPAPYASLGGVSLEGRGQSHFGAPTLLPLPACGERVGVRGRFHRLRLAEAPPHPEFARRARKFRLLPASGER